MSKPEFPKPSVGDPLIVVRPKTRNNPRTITPVRVRAMARFKVTLETPDGEDLPWYVQEYDIRTQSSWDRDRSSGKLHTAETWAWQRRENDADAYLSEARLYVHGVKGDLGKAITADKVGFVNALRRFEGLEEI